MSQQDTVNQNGLTAEALMKQRNEAMSELVKALLIVNGGGAVALLAFLERTWSSARVLVKPTAIGVAFLAGGALLAGALHLFRYYASWHHQKGSHAERDKHTRFYLTCAALSIIAFAIGVSVVVVGVIGNL